ncbi:MAG: restriction endonuclease subunit S, partial [Oscillospiraceae bacterium]|nr:restriction endonuclease subunit S [Oscillospiraceae bacterium]
VFDITSTSSSIDKINLVKNNGNYPYITRTERNNGVDSFVCEQPSYNLDKGSCITVGLDTQTAFYQPNEFYTGQNIQILRNKFLNANNAKFILPLLRSAMSVFSWGSNGATLTRLKRCKVLLPVNKNGNPDWEYMERYAKMITRNQIEQYLNHKT